MTRGPEGRRVTLRINPLLASELARSAVVRAGLQNLTDEIALRSDETAPVGHPLELHAGWEPGVMKASQRHEVLETPRGLVGIVAYMKFWSHMVHNGTSHSHPNPWLLNAALSVLVGRT